MKPKILIFIDWYKPGFKAGGPIRSISNLISQLNTEYEFYIVTRNTDYLESKPYSNIELNQWNDVDRASVYYLSKENQRLKNIKQLIKEVNPKIIYCNSLYSPFFTLIPLYLAKKFKIRSILAIRGMLSEGSLGIKSTKKKAFLLITKFIALFNKCTFHATTKDEKNAIQQTFGNKTPIVIAENLSEDTNILHQTKDKKTNHLSMVSIGRISPEKNTLYALKVLNKVNANLQFDIYGPIYNQDYWKKCKKVINELPENIIVKYKGILPHKDLNKTLKNYEVFFSPSTGENYGHSIIEAMINSCIPIISDQTPWRNLEKMEIGYDLPLNDPLIFSKKIDELAIMDKTEFNSLSHKTYLFAKEIIEDEEVIKKYNILFQ